MKKIFLTIALLALLACPAYGERKYTVDEEATPSEPDNYEITFRTPATASVWNDRYWHIDLRLDAIETGLSGSYAFKTFTITGQDSVVASSVSDSMEFEAGLNITITTDPATKTITWAASGGGAAGLGDLDDVSGLTYTDGNVLRANGSGFVEATLDHSDLDLDDGLNPHSLTPTELGAVDIAGDTMTGTLILSGAPTSDLHASTKAYVDAVAQGLSVRKSCRVTSTANVDEDNDLENGDTFNNLTLATNDRILLKDQTDASENGIYIVQASGAAVRATDYNETDEVTNGSFTFIWDSGATSYGGTGWVLVTADPITVDTTDLTFSQMATAGTYTAGDGLDLAGTTFSTDLASSGGLGIIATELQIKLDGSSLALGASGISLNTIAGSDLNELGDVNAGAPSDGQQLTWDDGTSKWVAAGAGGSGSSGGNVITEVTFIAFSRGTSTVVQWNNLPSAPGELFNSIASRKHMDLSAATEYRIVASMFALGYAGSDLNLYYSTDDSTYQVASDGGGEGELDISGGSLGFRKGLWASLVTGAKTTNSYITIVGKDGNGAVDPRFAWLAVQFKFPAGVITDESLQDKVAAMWTGNTETRIAITYQDADGTMDAVVEDDLTQYDWTSVSSTELTAARIEDKFLRNDGDDVTSGSITLDDGVGDSPPFVLKDGSNNTVSWTKLDAGGSQIDDSGALLFKVSGDTNDYMKMVTTANVPEFTFVGANGLITASGGSISFSNEHLATTGTLASGVATVTGVINTSVGLDAVGAVDMDYGSGDVTDHTFSTDGTGTSEIVLPTGSIDSTEILDDTILEVDLKAVDASADEDILTKEDTTGDFEWHSFLEIAAAQTGAVNLGGATSLEIPNANDVTANTTLGMLSLDADDLILYFGDGTNLVAIGGGMETVTELHVNYVVPDDAFSVFDAIDIVVDVSDQAATTDLHVIDIDAVGTQAGEAHAIATHGDIGVIEQYTGAWVSLDQTTPDADAGEIPSGGSWSDGLNATTLFEDDEDEIYVKAPNDGMFSEIRVILSTPSSSHISQAGGLVIEYQHTDEEWDAFIPIDGTNGFQQSGTIIWDADNLANWKSDSDPGGADGEEGYWIRIRRTRNSIGTDAVATTIETREAVIYGWNAAAQITADALVSNSLTLGTTRWDDGSDKIDGEQIAGNTIDQLAIDFGLGAYQVSAIDLPEFNVMTPTLGNILIADGTDFESTNIYTYYVPSNGVTTIQAAINAAEAAGGGLVRIAPGTYDEDVLIDGTGVTLQGAGIGVTIINKTSDSTHAITITANVTTIRDLTVSTTSGGGNTYNGIDISGAAGVTIERVGIIESDHRGIKAVNAPGLSIINCTIGTIGNTIDDQAITTDTDTDRIRIINNFLGGTIAGTNSMLLQGDYGVVQGNIVETAATRAINITGSETTIVGNQCTGAINDTGANNLIDANNT